MTLPVLSDEDIENLCIALQYFTPYQFRLFSEEAEVLGREHGYGVMIVTVERGRNGKWHPRFFGGVPTKNFPKEEAG